MFALKQTKTDCSTSGCKDKLTTPDLVFMLKHFGRNEDGVVTIFAIMMLMMMLMVGGIGVDLMRNEMERTRLQNISDRAVLAGADLDQTLDPEAVVNDYFEKAGMSSYLSTVTVDEGLNYRTVNLTANTVTPTRFMRLVGVDELGVPARSTAEERISNVEISMVLDISGSMYWNNKMSNLKQAAKSFVSEVIREETTDLISVSLVPYTAQVNIGPDIFNELLSEELHSYSHCIDFDTTDFNTPGINLAKAYPQMQNFENGSSRNYNTIQNPGCPRQTYERIVPLSQDNSGLKTTIDKYTSRANTSIHLGMKWGVALLDPAFRPVTQALTLDGKVDGIFAARPANYDDVETLKTILLMTDGQNVSTERIQPWYYANPSHYAHWNKYPLQWYLNRYVHYSQHDNWKYTKYSASQADGMLSSICTAAKDQGIVIWSVGFEVSDYSATVMSNCASSPSHFFRVEGVEISEAFKAIASQINQLRLTQ
ncbi:pilus assembly protein TadG-related protein [Pseudosulfitobacter sp. SM2401]|uniref:TadE/TadG family type IV pilus assembly protein n=1 Tax=Pseudosulfitobacter sp. SM2401 TaxID=3350098 RepID=UPI0036F3677E